MSKAFESIKQGLNEAIAHQKGSGGGPRLRETMATIIEKTTRMYNPTHPGEVFRRLYLEPSGVSVTEGAKRLGITRRTLSQFTNGRAGISSEMALRIAMATDTTAESWVDMQAYYDLWHARKKAKKLHVKRLTALPRQ